MVLYYYDPKWKKTLPYYDRLPLIFYLCEKPGKLGPGFLGLNLHYLPPRERALLLDAIYTTAEKTRNNEMKRVKITYNILKGMSKYYKPCVKHYLYGHIRSKFLVVAPSEWEKVCFLPIEQFEKASKRKVWRDSLGKI